MNYIKKIKSRTHNCCPNNGEEDTITKIKTGSWNDSTYECIRICPWVLDSNPPQYECCEKGWIHKEPTFPGFMEFLKRKQK
jgi:hypothetical protein